MAQQSLDITAPDTGLMPDLHDLFNRIEENTTELYTQFLDNIIVVKQSNAVDIFGSELDSTKEYLIDGDIDFTGLAINIVVPSEGLTIAGLGANISRLICLDNNYTLFTSPVSGCGESK